MDGLERMLFGLLLCTLPVPTAAEHCPDVPFDVVSASLDDRHEACRAAAGAIAAMAELGLEPTRPLGLTVVDHPFEPPYDRIPALYRIRSGRIELQTSGRLRDDGEATILGQPISASLYRSLVVHEIAHAVASMHGRADMRHAAQEYIAFSMQIASLPADERERILARADVGPFGSLDEVSDLYLMLDPQRFAAKAYQHFAASPDPAALLQRLLQLGAPRAP